MNFFKNMPSDEALEALNNYMNSAQNTVYNFETGEVGHLVGDKEPIVQFYGDDKGERAKEFVRLGGYIQETLEVIRDLKVQMNFLYTMIVFIVFCSLLFNAFNIYLLLSR